MYFYCHFNNGLYYVCLSKPGPLLETYDSAEATLFCATLNKVAEALPRQNLTRPVGDIGHTEAEPAYLPREAAMAKADREFGQPHHGHYGGTHD
jgi:hypothetical protein